MFVVARRVVWAQLLVVGPLPVTDGPPTCVCLMFLRHETMIAVAAGEGTVGSRPHGRRPDLAAQGWSSGRVWAFVCTLQGVLS